MTKNTDLGNFDLSQPHMFRNRVINGAITIDQRNVGANVALSTTAGFGPDRWFGRVAANTTGSLIAQTTDAPTGFVNSLKAQRTSSNTGTSVIQTGQIIEYANMVDLQGQYAVVSFWAKAGANFSAASNNITVQLAYGTTADEGLTAFVGGTWTGYANAISTTQAITTTWTQYYLYTSAVIPTTAKELAIAFQYTPVGTASTNDWFEVTGVQVERGLTATPYEFRHQTTEIQLCQRYYTKSYSLATAVATSTTTGAIVGQTTYNSSGVALFYCPFVFPVQMRAAPTLTFYSTGTGTSARVRSEGNPQGASATDRTIDSSSAGVSAGWVYTTQGNYSEKMSFHYTASAEL